MTPLGRWRMQEMPVNRLEWLGACKQHAWNKGGRPETAHAASRDPGSEEQQVAGQKGSPSAVAAQAAQAAQGGNFLAENEASALARDQLLQQLRMLHSQENVLLFDGYATPEAAAQMMYKSLEALLPLLLPSTSRSAAAQAPFCSPEDQLTHETGGGVTGETDMHRAFAVAHTKGYSSPGEYLAAIREHLRSATNGPTAPLVAQGASGGGKSSLLAQVALECTSWDLGGVGGSRKLRNKPRCIYHFIGSTSNSCRLENLLERIASGLHAAMGHGAGHGAATGPQDMLGAVGGGLDDRLPALLQAWEEASEKPELVVIVLDALNHIEDSRYAGAGEEGKEEALAARPHVVLRVRPLEPPQKRTILTGLMKLHNKSIDEQHLHQAYAAHATSKGVGGAREVCFLEAHEQLAEYITQVVSEAVEDTSLPALRRVGVEFPRHHVRAGAWLAFSTMLRNPAFTEARFGGCWELQQRGLPPAGAVALAAAVAPPSKSPHRANRALTKLLLSGNPLGDAVGGETGPDEGMAAIGRICYSCRGLTHLDLSDTGVVARGLAGLVRSGANGSALRTLVLSGNKLGRDGGLAVAKLLWSKHCALRTLNLSACALGGEDGEEVRPGSSTGVSALAEALTFNQSLTALYLSGNKLGAEDATALAEALAPNEDGAHCKSLATLDVRRNAVPAEAAAALAAALAAQLTQWHWFNMVPLEQLREEAVTSLDLRNKGIGVTGAMVMARWLVLSTSITSLNLSDSDIGAKGARALADALNPNAPGRSYNCSLTSLVLSGNNIGEAQYDFSQFEWREVDAAEGFAALGDMLRDNRTITRLDLSYNHLGPRGAMALADGGARARARGDSRPAAIVDICKAGRHEPLHGGSPSCRLHMLCCQMQCPPPLPGIDKIQHLALI
eukprot:gene9146-10839_t